MVFETAGHPEGGYGVLVRVVCVLTSLPYIVSYGCLCCNQRQTGCIIVRPSLVTVQPDPDWLHYLTGSPRMIPFSASPRMVTFLVSSSLVHMGHTIASPSLVTFSPVPECLRLNQSQL